MPPGSIPSFSRVAGLAAADERSYALINPWLASIVSFSPIVAFLGVLWICQPRPMRTTEGIAGMPWWAPLIAMF